MKGRKKVPDPKVDVLKASSTQDYLLGYGERISMDPELGSENGVELKQQVRITRKDKYGIYTVYAWYQDGTDDNDIRMALAGRQRLDTSDSWKNAPMKVEALAQDQTAEWLQANDEYGEFLDETSASHDKLVVCAPHGGMIENYTDEEAERVYSNLDGQSKECSCWRAKGWNSEIGAYDAWHITSTEISRDSFHKLDQIGDRSFEYAVAFHGYSEADIGIGGGASLALKQEVAAAIQAAVGDAYDVVVLTSGPYAGTSPDNLVNWLCGGNGIQIEQPYGARRDHWEAIADAVASVFAGKI
jgi:phage replication-related protein YjqB (UPF0714/DUF867 family)